MPFPFTIFANKKAFFTFEIGLIQAYTFTSTYEKTTTLRLLYFHNIYCRQLLRLWAAGRANDYFEPASGYVTGYTKDRCLWGQIRFCF